jgi:predicted Zn-dependent protease
VEQGVAAGGAAGADGCIVLVEEGSHADVRFACNTTTTNGVHRARQVSVVAVVGESVGTSTRRGDVGTDALREMAAAAVADAREAPPAEDAAPLVEPADGPTGGRSFSLAPDEIDASVLDGVLSSLSGVFARARDRSAVVAGFAELDVATLYLGSSTGLRCSHAQPTGAVRRVVGLGGPADDRPLARRDGRRGLAPARLGAPARRARGGPLRGHPPPVGCGRHGDHAGLRRPGRT